MNLSSARYRLLLTLLFLAFWIALAIEPFDREDWLLENLLAIVFAAVLVASYKRLPLSGISYTTIFLFLCLHTLGAHYTYSEVPYDAWIRGLTGGSLNQAMGWERNHFDRLVHFSYGLLLAYPIREVFLYQPSLILTPFTAAIFAASQERVAPSCRPLQVCATPLAAKSARPGGWGQSARPGALRRLPDAPHRGQRAAPARPRRLAPMKGGNIKDGWYYAWSTRAASGAISCRSMSPCRPR